VSRTGGSWFCMYGAVVVLSYVVITVFYCECRKRHGSSDAFNADEVAI